MKVKQTLAVMALTTAIICGSQTIKAQSWNLTGNSNATATSKLGTTNAKGLALTTNNQSRVYIDPSGNISVATGNLVDSRYRLYVSGHNGQSGSIWGDGTDYGVVGTGTYGVWGSGSHGVYG